MKTVTLRKILWPDWNQTEVQLEDGEEIVGVFEPARPTQMGQSVGGGGGSGGSYSTQVYLVIAKHNPHDSKRI